LTLGDAISLILTSPILVVFMGWIILGEKIGKKHILSAIIGFIGVLLISKPDFLTSIFGHAKEETENEIFLRIAGTIISATAGFLYACEAIIFRKAKDINNTALTHYLNVFSVVGFPFCAFVSLKFQ